ncbi:MAG TPA: hypothetical protein VNS88_10795 [Nitrospiraceae bacterium]|jgi:hypothetical protein|nr:hypothetical protein [Nitrospiraceae bacterium]
MRAEEGHRCARNGGRCRRLDQALGSSIGQGRCPTTSPIPDDLAEMAGRPRPGPYARGAPYHPMTQGKIERWHPTLIDRILLENYNLPGDGGTQVGPLQQPTPSDAARQLT